MTSGIGHIFSFFNYTERCRLSCRPLSPLLKLLLILFRVVIPTDVAEGDPDADCRSLAVQSLVLLDKSLKKQLQDQQALSLEP